MARFILDRKAWDLCLPDFSPDARIVGMEAPGWSAPMELDESTTSFVWPRPCEGVMVYVEDPSPDRVRARIHRLAQDRKVEAQDAGLSQVVGEAAIEESRSWRHAGSLAPIQCPVCSGSQLRVLGPAEAYPYIVHFASTMKMTVSQRASSHGVRWRLGTMDFDAFRCDQCLSACVNSPQVVDRVWIVRLDDA